ncbi:serine/threonine protein kinase [Elasticomyces elasticus]|nr:serine/threonine protein kinase [Elasticomyces elasticus]
MYRRTKRQNDTTESLPNTRFVSATPGDAHRRAAQTFACLKPRNTAAREAFHDVANSILQEKRFLHHQSYVHIEDEQSLLYLRDETPQARYDGNGMTDSASATERDTETELEHQAYMQAQEPKKLWDGYYKFDLSVPPGLPRAGWIAGRGRWPAEDRALAKVNPHGGVDFLLATQPIPRVRGIHARFEYKETGMLHLHALHPEPHGISLDGQNICKSHGALNHGVSKIQIGPLQYEFAYTARTEAEETKFQEDKRNYFETELHAPSPPPALSITPSQTNLQIGEWTFSSPLGRGGFGTVSAASNFKGEAVAIKSMVRSNQKDSQMIQREINNLNLLKPLLEDEDTEHRIMRLVDVIYHFGSPAWDSNGTRPFEYVWILSLPLAGGTFTELIHKGTTRDNDCYMALLKQVLLGLAFLHRNKWIHCDIKPANLGFISLNPPKAVVLDLGQARSIPDSGWLESSPGSCGNIGYLAPEMEQDTFNESIDVWALGVVGYELLVGSHPWMMAQNPWRTGGEQLRPKWETDTAQP